MSRYKNGAEFPFVLACNGDIAQGNLSLPATREEWVWFRSIGCLANIEIINNVYDLEISCCDEDVEELNYLANLLEDLDDFDFEKLRAVIDVEGVAQSAAKMINNILELDTYLFYPDITDCDELGRYYIQSAFDGIPDPIREYIDYDGYGRDVSNAECGVFSFWGYMVRIGSIVQEYRSKDDIPGYCRLYVEYKEAKETEANEIEDDSLNFLLFG